MSPIRLARKTLALAALAAGCTGYPSSTAPNPETTSVRFSVAATRPAILSALTAAATEMGMGTADAGTDAGFWRSTVLRVAPNVGASMMGLKTAHLQFMASLESGGADSVRVVLSGTQAYPDEKEALLRGPVPITRGKAFSSYLDSLAAKTTRRLKP